MRCFWKFICCQTAVLRATGRQWISIRALLKLPSTWYTYLRFLGFLYHQTAVWFWGFFGLLWNLGVKSKLHGCCKMSFDGFKLTLQAIDSTWALFQQQSYIRFILPSWKLINKHWKGQNNKKKLVERVNFWKIYEISMFE